MRGIAASALLLGASLMTVSSTEYNDQLGMKNYYYAAAAYCPNNID
jgi:DNA-binding CsgD family transcriptional regulator